MRIDPTHWLAVVCILGAPAAAVSHPSSGIVVNDKGEVFFVHSGKGVGKIDAQGQLVTTILKSERPWNPTGVAVWEGSVYVLEWTNANGGPNDGWRPRVRKLARDGTFSLLVEIKENITRP